MEIIKLVLIAAVALLHIYILILEMFLWTTPKGQKAFRMTAEQAQSTSVLAANQGLYNGFLAAGLIWSLVIPDPAMAGQVAIFFLACVVVAALYGGYSVGRKIMIIQGTPALLALLAVLFI